MIESFYVDEEGQTLVEYGLLVSLVALVVIGVLSFFVGKSCRPFAEIARNQRLDGH